MDSREMLNNVKAGGIKTADRGDETLVVIGNAFVRNLSAEVEWEERDRESGEMRKYNSIISILGWQWEKHWNVYTEEAPFGLMLSQLFEFLRSCIRCNGYTNSYIEWGWDTKEFYIISLRPAGKHLWHRCLSNICTGSIGDSEHYSDIMENAGKNALQIISKWDNRVLKDNEPFFVIYEGVYYLNCDHVCSRLLETGIGGSIGNSPQIKFNLLRYLRSTPILLRIFNSRKELESIEEKFTGFSEELKRMNKTDVETRNNLLEKYYSYLFRYKVIIYTLNHCLPISRGKYDAAEESLNIKDREFMKMFAQKFDLGETLINNNMGKAFWEDSGEVIG